MAVQIIVTLKCDAILDKVKCANVAEYETPDDEGGLVICQTCLDALQATPEKIAFPPNMGKKHQTNLVHNALNGYALKSYF